LILFAAAEMVAGIRWDGEFEQTRKKHLKMPQSRDNVCVVRQQTLPCGRKKTKAAVERVNERTATTNRITADTARTHKRQNYIEVNNMNNNLIHAMEIMRI